MIFMVQDYDFHGSKVWYYTIHCTKVWFSCYKNISFIYKGLIFMVQGYAFMILIFKKTTQNALKMTNKTQNNHTKCIDKKWDKLTQIDKKDEK